MTSYCTHCDTDTDPCPEHGAARRYLDPIVYERSPGGGWGVPEHEQARFENEHIAEAKKPAPLGSSGWRGEPRTIAELITDLDTAVFLSEPLEATVRAAYKANPHRTTRLVEKVVAGARDQTFANPEGYLAKHTAALTT